MVKILELFEDKKFWIGPKGYPMIWLNGKNKMLHEYIWERHNCKKPKGFHIHHKDENKLNYNISNLILVTNSDHQRIHAGWIKNNDNEWIAKPCVYCGQIFSLDEYYQRKGYTPCSKCKSCFNKSIMEYRNTPIIKDKMIKYKREYYLKNKK
jgi:hypothetical protein